MRDLFNVSFDVLLYDLTSTYFECDPPQAAKERAIRRRKLKRLWARLTQLSAMTLAREALWMNRDYTDVMLLGGTG